MLFNLCNVLETSIVKELWFLALIFKFFFSFWFLYIYIYIYHEWFIFCRVWTKYFLFPTYLISILVKYTSSTIVTTSYFRNHPHHRNPQYYSLHGYLRSKNINHHNSIHHLVISLFSLAFSITPQRFWTHWWTQNRKKWWWDNWFFRVLDRVWFDE